MSVPIHEVFYSLQAEGPRRVPAVFIRSGGCNFSCKGFGCKATAPDGTELVGCDTIRAASGKFSKCWTYYDRWEDLVEYVDTNVMPKFSKWNIIKPDIIWTGGESCLHWKDPVMQGTLYYYISRGHKITIETNGSVPIEFTRKWQNEIMFSMSVKLAHSGEPASKRLNPQNISNIIEHCPNSYLKFVVNPKTWDQDFEEISAYLRDIDQWVPIFLMPLGGNIEELMKNYQFTMETAVKLGFGFTGRDHILAWNTKEGV